MKKVLWYQYTLYICVSITIKTKKMKAKQIKDATKKMTFKQANNFIESLGFELELQENYPFMKSWGVKNNNEFFRITNYMGNLVTHNSEVKFNFNN